jgi:methionyl-tRNA formyltransferase
VRPVRIALLCAGEIGHRALTRVIGSGSAAVDAVFSYPVEPPQAEYFDRIQELCQQHGIAFFPARDLTAGLVDELWGASPPRHLIAIKWRSMISSAVIERIPGGLIVFHASLLPRYRGFAPLAWPLINGEKETGVTMFHAAEEVDSGDIIDQRRIPILASDDAGDLERKVSETVALMLEENLPLLAAGTARRKAQIHAEATYCIWRSPEDGEIDWTLPTTRIHNLIRGLARPHPGAFTTLRGERLTVWRAEAEENQRIYVGQIPGKVERIVPGRGVNVLTGDGVLRLLELQRDGEPPEPAWKIITRLKTHLGR